MHSYRYNTHFIDIITKFCGRENSFLVADYNKRRLRTDNNDNETEDINKTSYLTQMDETWEAEAFRCGSHVKTKLTRLWRLLCGARHARAEPLDFDVYS